MQSVYITTNRFSPEMVSVFASSVVDREFEPRLGKMDHQGISEILLKVVLTYPWITTDIIKIRNDLQIKTNKRKNTTKKTKQQR